MKSIFFYTHFLFLLLIFFSLKAEYIQLPGFPYSTIGNTSCGTLRGIGVVNINTDPFLEIIVSTFDATFAINYLGEQLWAAYTPHEAQQTMSFADIDNNGYLEILQSTRSGWIYILDKYGNNYPGWPKYFGTPSPYYLYAMTTPVAYDLDNDSQKEIIFGDFDNNHQSYLYVVDINGENFNDNFPFPVPRGVTCPPAIGDVDNDGIPEIICMAYYDLFILKPDGSILNGWPQRPFEGNARYDFTAPVLADLTEDGFLEIITAASGPLFEGIPSGIIIYKYDGLILDGWPQEFPWVTFCPPSIADLDNDGALEIICGRKDLYSQGNLLYIFNVDGENFLNAPYYSYGNVNGPIIIGNIDYTPNKEIIFDSNKTSQNYGYIQGIHCNGDTINDFPLRPKGCTGYNFSVFGDINQDGLLDLISYSEDFDSLWIYAYNLNTLYDPLQIEWKTYQYDFQRLGQYHHPFSFDPPINLEGFADEEGINLFWQPPENRRNYAYNVFRDDEFIKRHADTTFTDTCVISYTTYHYYLTSVYEQGYSPPSETIVITTDSLMSVDYLPFTNKLKISLNNFSNPFDKSTNISFSTAEVTKYAEIQIYNIKGQCVRNFEIHNPKSKINKVEWNGTDDNGNDVPSGIYLCKLSIGKNVIMRKMVLLR